MILEEVEEINFEEIMLDKLKSKAQRTKNIKTYLQIIKILQVNHKNQQLYELIKSLHQSFIFNQQFWLGKARLILNENEQSTDSIQLAYLGLQDGMYVQLGRMLGNKLIELFQNGKLRYNYIQSKLQRLIELFCYDCQSGSYFYQLMRKFYTIQNNQNKIRQIYFKEIAKHFNNVDIIYCQYKLWQQNDNEIKRIKFIYQKSLQEWQDQQISFNQSDISELNIFRSLKNLENKTNFQSNKYYNLIQKLETQFQKLWFLRRIALSRKQLVCQYLYKFQMFSMDDTEILMKYQSILTLSEDYEMLYLGYLVRRINRHLHNSEELQDDYNATWGNKVEFFRTKIAEFISKNRLTPKAQLKFMEKYYQYWIQVEQFIVKDKNSIIQLYQEFIKIKSSIYTYHKYAKWMLSLGCIEESIKILKRCCQHDNNFIQTIPQFQHIINIYGSVHQCIEMIKLVENYCKKQSQNQNKKQQTHQLVQINDKDNQNNKNCDKKINLNIIPQIQYNNVSHQQKSGSYKRDNAKIIQEIIQTKQRKKVHIDSPSTIFMKGIPITWKQSNVLKILKYSSHVHQVRMIVKNGEQKNYCYIEYQAQQQAIKQIKQNKSEYKMQLSKPPNQYNQNKTIFLSALPIQTTKQNIISLFKQDSKYIVDIRLISQKERCYAYVDLKDQQIKNQVYQKLKIQKLFINEKKIIIQLCDSDRMRNKKLNLVVFIKNLAYKANQKDLEECLKNKNIAKIVIPRNQQGKSKGFAYIEFSKFKDYQECIDMKQFTIKGRICQIYKSDRQITNQNQKKLKQQIEIKKQKLKNNKNNSFSETTINLKNNNNKKINKSLQKKDNNYFSNIFK